MKWRSSRHDTTLSAPRLKEREVLRSLLKEIGEVYDERDENKI